MKRILVLFLLLPTIGISSCVMDIHILFAINNEEIIQVDPGGKGVYSLKRKIDV